MKMSKWIRRNERKMKMKKQWRRKKEKLNEEEIINIMSNNNNKIGNEVEMKWYWKCLNENKVLILMKILIVIVI